MCCCAPASAPPFARVEEELSPLCAVWYTLLRRFRLLLAAILKGLVRHTSSFDARAAGCDTVAIATVLEHDAVARRDTMFAVIGAAVVSLCCAPPSFTSSFRAAFLLVKPPRRVLLLKPRPAPPCTDAEDEDDKSQAPPSPHAPASSSFSCSTLRRRESRRLPRPVLHRSHRGVALHGREDDEPQASRDARAPPAPLCPFALHPDDVSPHGTKTRHRGVWVQANVDVDGEGFSGRREGKGI
ncbi:hypothetical protein C8R45DRAFT_571067 [Mycena sanguinolenta]|nr:hypothetical protein C8R45DRAFT_571067 [Mycena sanguinolenta]